LHKRRVTGEQEQEGSWKKLRNWDVTFTKGIHIISLNTLIFNRKNQPRETGMEHMYLGDVFPIYLCSYSTPIFTSNLLGND